MSEKETAESNDRSKHEHKNKSGKSSSKKLVKRKVVRSFSAVPKTIVVYAKKNGNENNYVRLVGKSFDELLTNSTHLLQLNSAARKIFDENGQVIETIDDIPCYSNVSISQGEPYIDPMIKIKESVQIQKESFWGLNGLYIPKSKSKTPTRSKSATKINKQSWRILCFSGSGYLPNEAVEVITDGKDFEEFCFQCSSKFDYNGLCRRIFLYDSSVVNDLHTIIDNEESWVWNSKGKSPVCGPVWATLSEQLDLDSVKGYFSHNLHSIRELLKQNQMYLDQLRAMDEGRVEDVEISTIKSYSKKELKYRIEEIEELVYRYEDDEDRFKNKYDEIKEQIKQRNSSKEQNDNVQESKEKKSETEQKKIRAFTCTPGLRIKVYINGTSDNQTFCAYFNSAKAKKGIKDPQVQFNNLLDSLSENGLISNYNDNTRGLLVRRLFQPNGKEITSLDAIKYDDKICVSFGEDWIRTTDFIISMKFVFVDSEYNECMQDFGITHSSMKEFRQIEVKSEKLKGFCVMQHQHRKNIKVVPIVHVIAKESRIQPDKNKKSNSKDTESENVKSQGKSKKEEKPKESYEIWLWTKSGKILCKSLSRFCLGLNQYKNNQKDQHEDHEEDRQHHDRKELCYSVIVELSDSDNPSQYWQFTKEGLLRNKAYPDYYLTHNQISDVFNHRTSDIDELIANPNLIGSREITEDESARHPSQRWGVRQCSFSRMSEWRLCYSPNPEWNKRALIWPLNQSRDGGNTRLKWPLEGFMIGEAPPAQPRQQELDTRFPRKLLVMRNNDHKNTEATLVTGPDLTKLIKINAITEERIHCLDESVLQVEFQMFLGSCSGILRLNSAARRLFTESGEELFDLSSVENQSRVFVSQGEAWSSPVSVLDKMNLRSDTNKLAVDVERIKCFLRLHNPPREEYVIGFAGYEIEENVNAQVQLINNQLKEVLRQLRRPQDESRPPSPSLASESSCDNNRKMSFHTRQCDAAQLKWKTPDCDLTPDKNAQPESPKSERSKVLPIGNLSQNLLWQAETICSQSNPRICLFAEGIGQPVKFKRKELFCEDEKFKWILHSSGAVESQYYRGYVLTINCQKMLPFDTKSDYIYHESNLILDKAINSKYGKSFQRFTYDEKLGSWFALATNCKDLGISAAILSGICTKYVYKEPVSQPAFYIFVNNEKKLICQSCLTVLNGKYPVEPVIGKIVPFRCCYGGGFYSIKDSNLTLNHVYANATHDYYSNLLAKNRRNLLIKPCKNRTMVISPNIHVLLYLNGNGRLNKAKLAIGKSISQIMEMASSLFNLQKVVRILYTEDGKAITDDVSFRNYMSDLHKDDSQQLATINEESTPEIVDNESKEEELYKLSTKKLNVKMSDDESYFIVNFGDKNEMLSKYELNIIINGVSDTYQFLENEDSSDMMVINFEILKKEIITTAFRDDDDFEAFLTTVNIHATDQSLIQFFREYLNTIRIQLLRIKTQPEIREYDGAEDLGVTIESIDSYCDVGLEILSDRIGDELDNIKMMDQSNSQSDQFYQFNEILDRVMFSTKDLEPTSCSICIEFVLSKISNCNAFDQSQQAEDDAIGIEESLASGSVIMEPVLPRIKSHLSATNNGHVPEIELWVSQGEPFTWTQNVKSSRDFEQFAQLKSDLDNRKFFLRTVKAERLKNCDPGTLEPTQSQKNPVIIKGNWQFKTQEEQKLEQEISQLEEKLKKMKTPGRIADLKRDLYKQKHLKKYLIRLNNYCTDQYTAVWAENIFDLKENTTQQLHCKKSLNYVFNKDGIELMSLPTDQSIMTLSSERRYVSPSNINLQTHIKANWGRARRQYGEESTETMSLVEHRPCTLIDVDPFEPTNIMRSGMKEIPAVEAKTVFVYENGQNPKVNKPIVGYTLQELIKSAHKVLKLELPVKCFYTIDGKRIINFKEVLHDDTLAASVSGKGYIKYTD